MEVEGNETSLAEILILRESLKEVEENIYRQYPMIKNMPSLKGTTVTVDGKTGNVEWRKK